jgi:hypothetical protein
MEKNEKCTSMSFSKYNAVTALLCPSSTCMHGPDTYSFEARLLESMPLRQFFHFGFGQSMVLIRMVLVVRRLFQLATDDV